jgi:hypothetical protein
VPAPPKLPKWIDEAAVADLVAAEMEELRSEVERLAWTTNTGLPGPDAGEDLRAIYDLMTAESFRGWPVKGEKEAVEAALRGDVEPLADLLRPDATTLDMLKSNVKTLSPSELRPIAQSLRVKTLRLSTWNLIAQFLTGERNLRTGRLRGEPGRPTMSLEERRAESPVHDAAEEFHAIRAILRRLYYPKQSSSQIRARAMEIAAQRNRVELDTLVNYLKRPRKDRRRLTT